MMRLTQIDAILIRMLYLAAAGIVVLTVIGVQTLASVLFGLTFILVLLLWFSGAMRSVTWTDAILILMVGLSLVHVSINAWLEETAISFSYFKKYFMFLCTFVYFQAAYKLRIDGKTEKFLLRLISALAVFLLAVYAANIPSLYVLQGRVSSYLTFGFTNPNLTALFLMCIYIGEMMQFFRQRSAGGKLWHLLLAAAVCYFIWETKSRNCLLTLVLITVLCILLYLTKNGFRLSGWFALLVAVWPIVFVLLYMTMIDNAWIRNIFSFLVDEGKGLDARIYIWRAALYYCQQSPILGAYSQISLGTGMSQMHNTHLDILASYGTVVLILACYLLYSVIRSSDRGSENLKEDTMAKICFAGTIIMGMGEAALVSGGLGIYLFAGAFLLLCNAETKTAVKKE